tara:strand:- start:19 stop:435 length:417 start_codon:yes stop_codon:yes gene_type:complete
MKLQDVRKHNRKIERAYRNDELSVDEYFDQLLTIYKAVDTDEGLSAKDKICFHYFNPKGIYHNLPELKDFEDGETFYSGAYYLYGRTSQNYHVEQLIKLAMQKRPKRWNVDYTVKELEKCFFEYQEWRQETFGEGVAG